MSKETISGIWGFDDPIDEKKSEPPTNSCPNILCVMGKCTESSMQIKLKFDEPEQNVSWKFLNIKDYFIQKWLFGLGKKHC